MAEPSDPDRGPATTTSATSAAPRATRNPLRTAAIAVASVGLVATALAIVLPTVGGGAPSPEQAADRFFRALAEEDLVGMAEALPPGERAVLADALPAWRTELVRLGLLAPIELADVGGIDVTTDGVRFRVSASNGSAALVEAIAGRVTVTLADGSALLTDAARRAITTHAQVTLTSDAATRDFATVPLRLVAVRADGAWYLSLVHTVADAVRPGTTVAPEVGVGFPAADPDRDRAPDPAATAPTARLQGRGADGPEAAVRELIDALARNDPARFAEVVDVDDGGAVVADADWLFPKQQEGRPAIDRSSRLDEVAVTATGDGATRAVTVTTLDATFANDVHVGRVRYDGQCFDATYRLAPDTPPYASYLSCNGAPMKVTIVTDAEVAMRERESELVSPNAVAAEEAREAAELAARRGTAPGGTTTTLPVIDAFGQPFWSEADALAGPAYRPFDNPFSALAVFGGGADLPTFSVIERGGRWYVSPLRTLVGSLTTTLRAATPEQVDDLAARGAAVADLSAAEALAFESRDPDNLLFGPPAVKNTPMVAACFIEIKGVVGGRAAALLFPLCLRRLVAAGKADIDTVAPALLYRECLSAEHTPPPLPGSTYRRIFLASAATRACIERRVADGEGPPEVLDRLSRPEDQPCFAPYHALVPADPETRWTDADAVVERCIRDHVLDPRVPTAPPSSPAPRGSPTSTQVTVTAPGPTATAAGSGTARPR